MGNINIDIPEELHRELRIQAAIQGITLKELVITTLANNVKGRKT